MVAKTESSTIKEQKTKSRGNGEGTFYYVESKKLWAGQFVILSQKTGTSKRYTLYGKTKTAVKKKFDDLKDEIKKNGGFVDEKTTLYELTKLFVDTEYSLNRLQETSYKRKQYSVAIIKNSFIGGLPLLKITEKNILDFLSSLTEYSNSVISKVYGLTKRVFDYGIEKDIIMKNLFNGMMISKPKSKKPNRKCSALTLGEEKSFLHAILQEDKCTRNCYTYQFCIMLYTGMRMGEINALKLSDLDMKNKIIHVRRTITKDLFDIPILGQKTKTEAGYRDIIMNDDVFSLFQFYIKSSYRKNSLGLLFYNFEVNRPISTNQVNAKFQRICEKYHICEDMNKRTNQHMLRHTFATRCIESGMPANVLQKILGHTDIGTTMNTYCDVFKQFEEKHLVIATEYHTVNGLNLDQFEHDGLLAV